MKILGLVLVALLLFLNLLLFWPGDLFFLNDDFVHIPLTQNGVLFQTNSIRPIHELLVRFDLWCWGRWAPGYHITSLVLHFIVTFQVYKVTILVLETEPGKKNDYAKHTALVTVLLFLSYAGYSESLAWIIGRGPILSAIFLLFTLQVSATSRVLSQSAGCLAFACALFTYEQALLVPLVLWVFSKFGSATISKAARRYAVVLTLTSVLYLVARQVQTAEIIGNYEGGNFRQLNPGVLFANAGRFFTRLFVNPAGRTGFVVSAFVLVLVLFGIVLLLRNKVNEIRRPISFCICMMGALLAPMLSLGISTNSFESGRFLYLPAVFLCILFSSVAVYVSSFNAFSRQLTTFFVFCIVGYWLMGKWKAADAYTAASRYVQESHAKVAGHFSKGESVLVVDTLFQNYRGLPVFRSGYKEGIAWLYPGVDTAKIQVLNFANN